MKDKKALRGRPVSVLCLPGTDAMDVLDLNTRNISRWRIVGRKLRPRSYVDLGELVQQFRRATFSHSSASRDHQVVVQISSSSSSHHRQRHTSILLNIPHFFPRAEMSANNLIAIESHPHNRDLWASISIERHKMGEMPGSQGLSNDIIQNHCYRIPSFCTICTIVDSAGVPAICWLCSRWCAISKMFNILRLLGLVVQSVPGIIIVRRKHMPGLETADEVVMAVEIPVATDLNEPGATTGATGHPAADGHHGATPMLPTGAHHPLAGLPG